MTAKTRDATIINPNPPARRSIMVRLRLPLLLLTAAAFAAVGFYYWHYSQTFPTTNDAYVSAHIVHVAPQVGGPVVKSYVRNNESVRSGDPLVDIDPAPYDIALKSAAAQFDQAVEAAGKTADKVSAAAAKLADKRNALDSARKAFDLAKSQVQAGSAQQSVLDESAAALDRAEKAFEDAQADMAKAQEEIGKGGIQRTQLRVAAAALQKAELDRANVSISAPVGGWVSGMELRPGAMAQPGRPLFSIVENGGWWVDANFKETDLTRIRPGQKAQVKIDMYPGLVIDGVVDSISAGSGAVFSLLPPENATGNWVKVTQRFTVRVAIPKPPADRDRPLRVGASAYVTVDTSDAVK
ncbi:MAG: HlyD family secretion protein [Pseudomonadota bacterium]|nr:HlyD family secretion protein [Pseudomonadota bacterium]